MAESLFGSNNMINAAFNAWIMIYLFAIYAFIFAAAFIFEMRMAKFYDNKIHTRKWVITYIVTGLLCAALWLGISLVCQLPVGTDSVTFASNLTLSFKFLGEVLLITLIIGIFVAAFIFQYVLFSSTLETSISLIDSLNPKNMMISKNKETKKSKRREKNKENCLIFLVLIFLK